MRDFVTAYGPKRRVGVGNSGESMTKQSFKDDCDINLIIKRARLQGIVPRMVNLQAIYGDVSGIDFQAAVDLVRRSEELFAELPAQVRARFHNDPAAFLTFCDDPVNTAELVRLGLATSREVEELDNQQQPDGGRGAEPSGE